MHKSRFRSRKTFLGMLSMILAAALLLPSASFGQSSSVGGYGGTGGEVAGALDDGASAAESGSAVESDSSNSSELGSLPFTGVDIGWMVGGGVLLIGAGIAMGRAASRAPEVR